MKWDVGRPVVGADDEVTDVRPFAEVELGENPSERDIVEALIACGALTADDRGAVTEQWRDGENVMLAQDAHPTIQVTRR